MRRKPVTVLEACLLVVTFGCAASPQGTDAEKSNATALHAPLTTGPSVGPEFDLGQPAEQSQSVTELGQVIATNDSGVALVVWSVGNQSWIPGIGGTYMLGTAIYAARVDANGNVLDPAGIRIAATDLAEMTPAVASDGSNWFVTWAGQRYDGATGIFAAQVTSTGEVLDSTVVSPLTTDDTLSQPAIAFDGTNFLVLWQRGADVYVARVDEQGVVLDPSGTFVATMPLAGGYPQGGATLAFDGTDWLVLWTSSTLSFCCGGQVGYTWHVLGTRVDHAGAVVGPSLDIPSATANVSYGKPAVSCHAGACFAAWQAVVPANPPQPSGSNIVGASITANAVNNAFVASSGYDVPAVAWDGAHWLVTWRGPATDQSKVQATRLSLTGALVDPAPVTVATNAQHATVGPSPSGALVTWAGAWPAEGTFAGFVANGTPASSFVVSCNYVRSPGESPRAAASKSNWLVVWEQLDVTTMAMGNIRGTRVSPTGSILDPLGIPVGGTGTNQATPTLASDGENWLAVWGESHPGTDWDVYATRIASDGHLLDAAPELIAGGEHNQSAGDVAFDGSHWLVSLYDGSVPAILARRIATDGTVLDPNGIALGGSLQVQGARAAGGDGQWLVAGNMYDRVNFTSGVFGQRIADDGSLLDTEPFPIGALASSLDVRAVVYGDGAWLVVGFDSASGNLYGARVSPSGAVLDSEPILLSAQGSVANDPSVAYDGTDWLVAWTDARVWPAQYRQSSLPADVYATRVSDAGEVLEPDGFALATGTADQRLDELAGGHGRWLAVYSSAAGPDAGLRARIIQNACTPLGSTDATCDGIDDDCDGVPDDDFTPTATTCGTGACAATGVTSCAGGQIHDSCVTNGTDSDGDGVPDCSDACPLVAGAQSDGCPVVGVGGAGGEAGEGGQQHGGSAGISTGGSAGTSGAGGTGAVAGNHGAGTGGTNAGAGGSAGHAGHAGHAGDATSAGEAGEGGGGATPSGGNGHGGSAAGKGGKAGASGNGSGQAGANGNPPPQDEGCGCSVPVQRTSTPWALGLGLIGASIVRRRRGVAARRACAARA